LLKQCSPSTAGDSNTCEIELRQRTRESSKIHAGPDTSPRSKRTFITCRITVDSAVVNGASQRLTYAEAQFSNVANPTADRLSAKTNTTAYQRTVRRHAQSAVSENHLQTPFPSVWRQ
jgi:hypothetical protein